MEDTLTAELEAFVTPNKYLRWYIALVDRCLELRPVTVTSRKAIRKRFGSWEIETHHIIPKSISGCNKPHNLVHMTAREHFIAHLLLARIFTNTEHGWKMWLAVQRMTQQTIKVGVRITSHTFSKIREESVAARRGCTFSEERNRKISDAHRGRKRIFSENHRKNISLAKIGNAAGDKNAMSDPEKRAKVGASKVGRKLMVLPDGKRKYVFPTEYPEYFIP